MRGPPCRGRRQPEPRGDRSRQKSPGRECRCVSPLPSDHHAIPIPERKRSHDGRRPTGSLYYLFYALTQGVNSASRRRSAEVLVTLIGSATCGFVAMTINWP